MQRHKRKKPAGNERCPGSLAYSAPPQNYIVFDQNPTKNQATSPESSRRPSMQRKTAQRGGILSSMFCDFRCAPTSGLERYQERRRWRPRAANTVPLATPSLASNTVGMVFFFGRYVLNNSPTWTEILSLVVVLYGA
jgi:hypothetical protein